MKNLIALFRLNLSATTSRLRFLCSMALVLNCAWPALTNAAPISYTFTATVTGDIFDPANVLSGVGVTDGAVGTGVLTWDADAIASALGSYSLFDQTYASDPSLGTLAAFTLSVGSFTVTAPMGFAINTTSQGLSAGFDAIIGGIEESVGRVDSAGFSLFSSVGTQAPGPWPLNTFDPTVFDTGTLFLAGYLPQDIGFHTTITDLHQVPEPASFLLVGVGLGVVGGIRRRRQRTHPAA